jgi:hypothetical protein
VGQQQPWVDESDAFMAYQKKYEFNLLSRLLEVNSLETVPRDYELLTGFTGE